MKVEAIAPCDVSCAVPEAPTFCKRSLEVVWLSPTSTCVPHNMSARVSGIACSVAKIMGTATLVAAALLALVCTAPLPQTTAQHFARAFPVPCTACSGPAIMVQPSCFIIASSAFAALIVLAFVCTAPLPLTTVQHFAALALQPELSLLYRYGQGF